ncbi:MAG TPA: hypothetical protein VHE61_05960 [Opitutaceae bacterium]|nr:hypothetical protein [Opitutaceae bacterium]
MPHALNFFVGWCLILGAFVVGAAIGIGFHRDGYLGGYASFRRRLLRLGHVALAALGILNVLFGLAPVPVAGTTMSCWSGGLLIAGGATMPLICFLAAWRPPFRHLFFVPVTLLVGAVVLVIVEVAP